jgi:hypothetical protein
MNNRLPHLEAAKASDTPCAVVNLKTDSKTAGSNSASDSFSSPQVNAVAEEKSTESIKPGPPISTHSASADKMLPANPSELIQDDSIRTETMVSDSSQPLSTSNASSFDDSIFLETLYFYGLARAKSIAEQRGWHLSKPPESLLEDEVQRRADWYRAGMVRGFAVLPAEQMAAIKAGVFRGRK